VDGGRSDCIQRRKANGSSALNYIEGCFGSWFDLDDEREPSTSCREGERAVWNSDCWTLALGFVVVFCVCASASFVSLVWSLLCPYMFVDREYM
jgi:hypothetical protein